MLPLGGKLILAYLETQMQNNVENIIIIIIINLFTAIGLSHVGSG